MRGSTSDLVTRPLASLDSRQNSQPPAKPLPLRFNINNFLPIPHSPLLPIYIPYPSKVKQWPLFNFPSQHNIRSPLQEDPWNWSNATGDELNYGLPRDTQIPFETQNRRGVEEKTSWQPY